MCLVALFVCGRGCGCGCCWWWFLPWCCFAVVGGGALAVAIVVVVVVVGGSGGELCVGVGLGVAVSVVFAAVRCSTRVSIARVPKIFVASLKRVRRGLKSSG